MANIDVIGQSVEVIMRPEQSLDTLGQSVEVIMKPIPDKQRKIQTALFYKAIELIDSYWQSVETLWNFDEEDGATTFVDSANGDDLTVKSGTATMVGTQNYGNAVSVASGRVSKIPPTQGALGHSAFTYEVIFKLLEGNRNVYKWMCFSTSGTAPLGLRFGDSGFGNRLQVGLTYDNFGNIYEMPITMDDLNDGQWHHGALVRDDDHNLSFYLDGARQVLRNNQMAGAPVTSWRQVYWHNSTDIGFDNPYAEIAGIRLTREARYSGDTCEVPTEGFPIVGTGVTYPEYAWFRGSNSVLSLTSTYYPVGTLTVKMRIKFVRDSTREDMMGGSGTLTKTSGNVWTATSYAMYTGLRQNGEAITFGTTPVIIGEWFDLEIDVSTGYGITFILGGHEAGNQSYCDVQWLEYSDSGNGPEVTRVEFSKATTPRTGYEYCIDTEGNTSLLYIHVFGHGHIKPIYPE